MAELKQQAKTQGNLEHYWMPFSANRQFKQTPRLLASAEGMYYLDVDGRQVLDGTAGLWCCNAGHGRAEISEAVSRQIREMDYAPSFQMGHPLAFELAERLSEIAPPGMNRIFFTNSGSESVDTALKLALCYHRANGEPSRSRFIGRELGYHGVGFGGISVGGIGNNRKGFSPQLLGGVDHLPHTLDMEANAFSRGLPEHGADKAEALEGLIALHGAENIAAVIVEPMSGSAGVILPPKGYLKRLREITQKYGILLIFDEVITGFGRVGGAFASNHWDVTPDIMTTAKALNNGAIPMGAVFVQQAIHDACMQGPEAMIEFFHGYTYSGIRLRPRRHWPPWISTVTKSCLSALQRWRPILSRRCTVSRGCPMSSIFAIPAWWVAFSWPPARKVLANAAIRFSSAVSGKVRWYGPPPTS